MVFSYSLSDLCDKFQNSSLFKVIDNFALASKTVIVFAQHHLHLQASIKFPFLYSFIFFLSDIVKKKKNC